MPSLFSKFRHRKSASQSSTTSGTSNPPSPRSSTTNRPAPSSPAAGRGSVDASRRSVDASAGGIDRDRSQGAPGGPLGPGAVERQHSERDVVIIDRPRTPGAPSGRDETGHSSPFNDEVHRPDLPTTSSNANNPVPVPNPSGSAGSTKYVPQVNVLPEASQEELARKPLPAVPEGQSPLPRSELNDFPIPPHQHDQTLPRDDQAHRTGLNELAGGPVVPPRSPQRTSISEPSHARSHHGALSPPLPHVTSVDRSALHEREDERPGLVGSASRPAKADEPVTGRYPHVAALPAVQAEEQRRGHDVGNRPRASVEGSDNGNGNGNSNVSRKSSKFVEVPRRGSSLMLRDDPEIQAFMSSGDPSVESGLSNQLADLSLQQSRAAEREITDVNFHPELQVQREQFIATLVEGSEARLEHKGGLTEEGAELFKRAGMERVLGTEDTVDMRSKLFDPVVKETIFPKEHTEYTTVINRCIHKTHYIPLIQPIHDPEPIVLATRHRIFSHETGKWHEVVGDAAAVEILGEDVFYNGPRENRELRRPALPGLEEMDEEAIRMAREAGIGATGYSTATAAGVGQSGAREYKEAEQIAVPVYGDKEDVAVDGIGLGGGTGRVLEREYKLGEEKSDWREIATYVGLENGVSLSSLKGLGKREAGDAEGDNVGVAL